MQPPFPCCVQPPPPLLFLLPCFFVWTGDCATFVPCIILRHMSILAPLYLKDLAVNFMQEGLKFTEFWHTMWFLAGTLILYHTHARKHAHTRTHTHTHTHAHVHAYAHTITYSNYLYYIEWIIQWYLKCFFQYVIPKLLTCISQISVP